MVLDPRDPRVWREPEPDSVDGVERRLRSLEDWRLETRTTNRILGRVLTGLFGVSVLSTIATLTTLIVLLSEHHP